MKGYIIKIQKNNTIGIKFLKLIERRYKKKETAQKFKIKMQLKLVRAMQKTINENLVKISKQLKQ